MAEYERILRIVDAQEDNPRQLNGIEVLPATEFLRRMWQGEIF